MCFPINDETKRQISFVAIGKKFFDVLVFMTIVFVPIRNAAREKSRSLRMGKNFLDLPKIFQYI